MWPRRTAPEGEPASAALILADGYRVIQTTLATIVIGSTPVTLAVGNAADWAPWAGITSAILLVPAWLVLIIRAGRSRVAVSTAGIQIRRVFVTRTIAPDDYDGVTWNPTLFPSGGASLAIRRKSGPPVSAPAAMSMVKNPFSSVEDDVVEIGKRIAAGLTGPTADSRPHPGP